jgi:hypothetical protein
LHLSANPLLFHADHRISVATLGGSKQFRCQSVPVKASPLRLHSLLDLAFPFPSRALRFHFQSHLAMQFHLRSWLGYAVPFHIKAIQSYSISSPRHSRAERPVYHKENKGGFEQNGKNAWCLGLPLHP